MHELVSMVCMCVCVLFFFNEFGVLYLSFKMSMHLVFLQTRNTLGFGFAFFKEKTGNIF